MSENIYQSLFDHNFKDRESANFYLNRYIKFIEYCKNNPQKECDYFEEHHIIPKSWGGKNSKENLIKLSARQHFIVHWILSKTRDRSMMYSFWGFLNHQSSKEKLMERNYKVASRIYENFRIEFSKENSGSNNPMFGRTTSDYHKDRVRESNRTRKVDWSCICGLKNPSYGKHWYKDELNHKQYYLKEGDPLIEKLNLIRGMFRSKEHNEKIGKSNKGKKKNYRVFVSGKKCMNDGKKDFYVLPEEIDKYLKLGYILGGKSRKRN